MCLQRWLVGTLLRTLVHLDDGDRISRHPFHHCNLQGQRSVPCDVWVINVCLSFETFPHCVFSTVCLFFCNLFSSLQGEGNVPYDVWLIKLYGCLFPNVSFHIVSCDLSICAFLLESVENHAMHFVYMKWLTLSQK